MDAETLRLVITATVAVVAGLGGAALTAGINRQNTKDTLATSRLVAETQLREAENREHAVWLRNQKQEAYTDFMRLAQSVQQVVVRSNFASAAATNPDELGVARSRIKMIGTPAVRKVALSLELEVSELYNCHERLHRLLKLSDIDKAELTSRETRRLNEDIDHTLDNYFESRGKFSKLMIEFVVEVRKDLGTVTSDDAELDAVNGKLILTPEDVEEMDETEKLSNPEDTVLA